MFRRIAIVLVLSGLVLYGILSLVLASLAIDYRDMIDPNDTEWQAIFAPEWDVPLTETIELENGERVLVADVYDNPSNASCAVIIMHGIGGTRALVRQYGSIFWQLGCDVMSFDFAPRNNDVLLTFGYYEKDDLAFVLDWFAGYTGLEKTQIGIWSGSYGAATTLQMLRQESDLAWVVADSSYASMRRILSEQAEGILGPVGQLFTPGAFFVIEARTGIDIDAVSPETSVRGIDVPILFLHSEDDELIPMSHTQAIYENANQESSRLVVMGGAAHMEAYYDNKLVYRSIVYDFLAEFVPDFGEQIIAE